MRNAKKLLALVLAFVMVLGMVPAVNAQTVHTHGIEEYPEIELGVETIVSIDESGKTVYFRYTPEVTAEYTFASHDTNWVDPQGYLYDSEMNLLAQHEDNGTIDFNFTLVYTLEAGVTYVYATNLFNAYRMGVEYPVILTADLHNYVGVVTKEATCTEDGVITYTCDHCGDSYTEVIPAAHDFVDGICSRCGEEYGISGVCGDELTWKLNAAGVLSVSGTGEMYDYTLYGETVAPWTAYADGIKSVVLGEGVTNIGSYAFVNCSNLVEVTMPDTVTVINDSAFRNCSALAAVDFSANLTNINNFAFYGCSSLTAADLGEKIEVIGSNAFYGCAALAELNLGEVLLGIDTLAFSGCESLTEVTMPDTVVALGTDVFSYCTALTTVKLSDGLTDLPTNTFESCYALTTVELPEYLSTIQGRAFIDCFALESLKLPVSVIAVGDYAFSGCYNLTDLNLPMALSYAGYFAFNNCTGLGDFDFPPNLTYFTGGMFNGCTGLTQIIFPAGTTYVDDDAFAGCVNVKKIVFTGPLPSILSAFVGIKADAWYPANDESWTSDFLLNYGGSLTWHAMCKNHTYGKWTPVVDATCTESGIEERVCSECKWSETRVSEPTGHIWDRGVVQDNQTLYTCMICGVTRLDDHVHAYETAVTAPTCTEKGFTTYTCACGDSYTDNETAALGHLWKGVECERCDAVRENPFTDVPNNSFCIDAVLWAVEEGITEGTSDTTFNPGGACQRAIVVTFLWRAAGSPEPTMTTNPFTDVKENAFYYKAVLWAVEKGITTGTSETTFDPGALCNRATVVTFLYRALGEPEVNTTENPFTDVKADSWYGPAVLWAVENGVTEGVGNGLFAPGTNCNRAQVVTFLHRAMA